MHRNLICPQHNTANVENSKLITEVNTGISNLIHKIGI